MDKLTFYAMTTSEKLDRIGMYLEQRLSRDISRHRIGFVLLPSETKFFLYIYYLLFIYYCSYENSDFLELEKQCVKILCIRNGVFANDSIFLELLRVFIQQMRCYCCLWTGLFSWPWMPWTSCWWPATPTPWISLWKAFWKWCKNY